LGDEAHWKVMSAESLYSTLIRLQDLVTAVEASTSDNISWPLVSYCDHFWNLLFSKKDVSIFYSVFKEHNFGISSFSARLRSLLDTLLPPAVIDKMIGTHTIYCLQISSLETDNLPSYANIGHEFGHALYWEHGTEIVKIVADEAAPVLTALVASLPPGSAASASKRCTLIIHRIAMELFCDLVGVLVVGPGFLLSLHEMGWGSSQNTWSLSLSPKDAETRAYPSFAFRLAAVKGALPADCYKAELPQKLSDAFGAGTPLASAHLCVTDMVTDHSLDIISATPSVDRDAAPLEATFTKHLTPLKAALDKALDRFKKEILSPFTQLPEFAPVLEQDIYELIRRLEADILPNIIPDGSLLGKPATFAAVLNACALYRMHVLTTRTPTEGPEPMSIKLSKVDRLTAKALEVSYVQHEFNNRKTK
jgi:hypothetical protein